jgi:hypothetical protein
MSRLVVTLLVLVGSALAVTHVAHAQSRPTITVAAGQDPGDRQLIVTGAELDSKAAGFDRDQPPRLWILGQAQPHALTADVQNTQRWTVNLPAELCKKLRDALTIVYVEYGTMLAGPIGVPIDDLTPVAYAPDLKLEKLPAAIHGTLTGDQTQSAVFMGKKGDRVQVDIEARRLGGKLRPVIHLYDARKVQLAWAQSSRPAGGDARLSFVLPSDGDYRVEWHDALFKGEAPGMYRLKVGTFSNVEHLFPLVASLENLTDPHPESWRLYAGETELVRLGRFSNVQPKSPHSWVSASQRMSGLPQEIEPNLLNQLGKPKGFSPRPVPRGTSPEEKKDDSPAEEKKDDSPLKYLAPVGLNGILTKPGEEDRWLVRVVSGKTYRFAVLATQADSPVDAVLTIYDGEGKKQLMTADDAAKSADPTLEYTVPKDMKTVTVAIKDLLGRGGLAYAYNIEVTDAKAVPVTATWTDEPFYQTRGGRMLSRIVIERKDKATPVKLQLHTDDASESIARGNFDYVAEMLGPKAFVQSFLLASVGSDSEDNLFAPVKHRDDSLSRGNHFYALGAPLFYSDRETPFTIDWENEPEQLPRGGLLPLKIRATRKAGSTGLIRLTLVTNQPAESKTIKENNQDKVVPASEKMLRLEGKSEIAADALNGTVMLQVPSDLPRGEYLLALRAELLSKDGKRVLAETTTTLIQPKTVYPLQLALDDSLDPKKPADVRAGTGDTLELRGKIERTAEAKGPVRVTVEGWPKDLPPPLVDLPADQSEFQLPLRLPFKEAKAALKDVKLVAQAQPTPGPQTSGARSPALPLALRVVAGEKPTQNNRVLLFDEEADFPAKFNSSGAVGKGEVSLDDQSASRGKVALKFSPPMKSQPNLPDWHFKIRQNPGSGEYRYLRFTWKKQGAGPLGLQLAHDGKFGPTDKGGPSYRYHGGPGNTLGASLTIRENLPAKDSFEVVRDLYADFGEFTLTGFGAVLGDKTSVAYFDELTLGQTLDDLE